MATPTQEDLNLLKDLTEATTQLGNVQANLGTIAETVSSSFASLSKSLGAGLDKLDDLKDLSSTDTTRLAVLAGSAIKVREAFTGLASVDFGNLNTFTNQIDNIKDALLSGGTAASKAADAVSGLVTTLKSHGVASTLIEAAMRKGSRAVVELYKNMMVGADKTLRLQRSIFQLAAQTGQLDEVMKAAGKTVGADGVNLSNLNNLTQVYTKSILDSMEATGLSVSQVEKYFGTLNTIPGAMTATVKGGAGMNENISMLTATVNYATGAGRKFEDVVEDMRIAFRDYNMVGKDALQFTARMGELSNKFHVELSDVQSALRNTAENFKMFGKEAEGAANMMNQYLGALEGTGLSGHAAIEVVQGLTAGIKDMGIAQKAFLSAQTGGPGGLMGAFQIEKLLREGHVDEVFEKIRQQMTKQFGQIVNLEEASKSPQAAAALTKQMMILRQGPLGQFVKDDQSAIRLLEAFKAKAEGRPGALTPELSSRIVQDKMADGVAIQKLSYTELTKINNKLEALRYFAGAGSLEEMQKTMTAGAGNAEETSEATQQLRADLSKNMQSADAGRQETKNLATDLGRQMTTVSRSGAQALSGFVGLRHGLGSALEAPIQEIEGIKAGKDKLEEAKLSERVEAARVGQFVGTVPGINVPDLEEAATAGGAERAGTRPAAVAQRAGAIVGTPGRLGEIVVHVEGYCLECSEKIRGTTQSYAVNTGQKARK